MVEKLPPIEIDFSCIESIAPAKKASKKVADPKNKVIFIRVTNKTMLNSLHFHVNPKPVSLSFSSHIFLCPPKYTNFKSAMCTRKGKFEFP